MFTLSGILGEDSKSLAVEFFGEAFRDDKILTMSKLRHFVLKIVCTGADITIQNGLGKETSM